MRISIAWLPLIVAFTGGSTIASETAMVKYRNYTPQQVRDMPEKLRNSEMPMAYIFAAQRGLAADSDLLFSLQLNQLMYSGIHDFASAKKAFQADLGDAQTGVLTVSQIHQLEYRSDLQKLTRGVSFPDSHKSSKSAEFGTVEGTVTMLDEKIAWPINHNKIKCFKSEGTCEVHQVMLALPDDKSWAQQYQVMIDRTDYYNITRWSADAIDAEYPSKPNDCRTTSLSLNFKTKEFYFITKNAGGNCEFLGKPIEKLTKPRISKVTEGKEIFEMEFARIRKIAFGFLASDFRRRAENFIEPAKKN